MTTPNVPALDATVRAWWAGCRSAREIAIVTGWPMSTTRARLRRVQRLGLLPPRGGARIPTTPDELEVIRRRFLDPAWGVRLVIAERELRGARDAEASAAIAVDLRPTDRTRAALHRAERRTRRAAASLERVHAEPFTTRRPQPDHQ